MWSDKGHTEIRKVEVGLFLKTSATLAHCSRLVDRATIYTGQKRVWRKTLCDFLQICEIGVICGFKFGI